MSANPLFSKSQVLARAVQARNGRALLVGGYVRDELLGRAPKDADVEVYGLQAPDLRATLETLGRVDCVGESFRVYKLVWHERKIRYELDVSLPRRDMKVGEGHKGFEVQGDPFASFEDAARRRDFTLNAILRDPLSGEIIDPFGGQTDLRRRHYCARLTPHISAKIRCAFCARCSSPDALDCASKPATVALMSRDAARRFARRTRVGRMGKMAAQIAAPVRRIARGQRHRRVRALVSLSPNRHRTARRRIWSNALDGAAPLLGELEMPHQVALMLSVIGSFLGWRDTKSDARCAGHRQDARRKTGDSRCRIGGSTRRRAQDAARLVRAARIGRGQRVSLLLGAHQPAFGDAFIARARRCRSGGLVRGELAPLKRLRWPARATC